MNHETGVWPPVSQTRNSLMQCLNWIALPGELFSLQMISENVGNPTFVLPEPCDCLVTVLQPTRFMSPDCQKFLKIRTMPRCYIG